jgi:murein DD-endopeptidase MepM/ murein hydrolase activator NlpD
MRQWRQWRHWRITGLVAFLLLAVASTVDANVDPPVGAPKFLSLPFDDPEVKLGQGWYYVMTSTHGSNGCRYEKGDVAGWGAHCGIDYGTYVNDAPTRRTFRILAAAAGKAYLNPTLDGERGYMVVVEHEIDGQEFCTRYLHTDPLRFVLPPSKWVPVEKGQQIAWSGKSGTTGIHLHFDAYVGPCSAKRDRVDPYDIAAALLDRKIPPDVAYYPAAHYQGANRYAGCGARTLFTSCPAPGIVPYPDGGARDSGAPDARGDRPSADGGVADAPRSDDLGMDELENDAGPMGSVSLDTADSIATFDGPSSAPAPDRRPAGAQGCSMGATSDGPDARAFIWAGLAIAILSAYRQERWATQASESRPPPISMS